MKNIQLGGIKEFEKENIKGLVDILSERDTMKKFIDFLKKNCGMKYKEIQRHFNIPQRAMENLKKIQEWLVNISKVIFGKCPINRGLFLLCQNIL